MQLIIRILLALFTILFGYGIIMGMDVYHEGPFDFHFIGITMVIVMVILVFYFDYKYFLAEQRWYQFSTSFAWVIILLITGYKLFDNHLTDTAKLVIRVSGTGGENRGLEFEFKQNNRLIITNSYIIGRDIYYCTYQKHGDTLTIKHIPASADANQFPTKGIIRQDSVFWNNGDTMLVNK